jgi:hypothetical protein
MGQALGYARAILSRLRRFRSLDAFDRSLLLEAAMLLVVVRVAVVVVPFARVRRALVRVGRRFPRRAPTTVPSVVRAVAMASRNVPGGKHCLTEALTGQLMLARSGLPSRLRMGLGRGPEGELHGHAWLEIDGDTVIGATEEPFTTIESFKGDFV